MEPRTSLRHPHVSLRDTIAAKLLLLARPGVPWSSEDHKLALETVDDFAEYIVSEIEEQEERRHD